MSDLVQTTQGLIDRAALEAEDIVTESEGLRTIATEWRLNGVLVKRSVWVDVLRGLELGSPH